jgi:hypothetical protein
VISRIEGKTSDRYTRILARSFLNPGRSFANVMETEKPWHRDTRGGAIHEYLAINPRGGAAAVFNLNSTLGIETDVAGCQMLGLGTNLSGDMTTFVAGPRLTKRGAGRWTPWVNLLAGGEKATQELLMPDVKATVLASANPWNLGPSVTQGIHPTQRGHGFCHGIRRWRRLDAESLNGIPGRTCRRSSRHHRVRLAHGRRSLNRQGGFTGPQPDIHWL